MRGKTRKWVKKKKKGKKEKKKAELHIQTLNNSWAAAPRSEQQATRKVWSRSGSEQKEEQNPLENLPSRAAAGTLAARAPICPHHVYSASRYPGFLFRSLFIYLFLCVYIWLGFFFKCCFCSARFLFWPCRRRRGRKKFNREKKREGEREREREEEKTHFAAPT